MPVNCVPDVAIVLLVKIHTGRYLCQVHRRGMPNFPVPNFHIVSFNVKAHGSSLGLLGPSRCVPGGDSRQTSND